MKKNSHFLLALFTILHIFSESVWANQQYTIVFVIPNTIVSGYGTTENIVARVDEHMEALRRDFYREVPRPSNIQDKNYTVVSGPSGRINYNFSYHMDRRLTGTAYDVSAQFERDIDNIRNQIFVAIGIQVTSTSLLLDAIKYTPLEQDYTIVFDATPSTVTGWGTAQDIVYAVEYRLDSIRRSFYSQVPKPPRIRTPQYTIVSGPQGQINYSFYYSLPRAPIKGTANEVSLAFEDELSKIRREIFADMGIQTAALYDPLNGMSLGVDETASVQSAFEVKRREAANLPNPPLPYKSIMSTATDCMNRHKIKPGDAGASADKKAVASLDCMVGNSEYSIAYGTSSICEKLKPGDRGVCYSMQQEDFSALLAVKGIDVKDYDKDIDGLLSKKTIGALTDYIGSNKTARDLANAYEKANAQYACTEKATTNLAKINCLSDGFAGKNEQQAATLVTCLREAETNIDRANCGQGYLGRNEREALRLTNCAVNSTSYVGMAACASGVSLTDEQQIYLDCAPAGSGGPSAYGACVGGALVEKELEKCIEQGFGGEGCFGKNNFFRQNIENVRRELCQAVGHDSEACSALSFVIDNAIMPGKNHEVVKYFNNALGDLTHGPGPNNDFRRAAESVNKSIDDAKKAGRDAYNDAQATLAKAEKDFKASTAKAEADTRRELANFEGNVRAGLTDGDGCVKVFGCTTLDTPTIKISPVEIGGIKIDPVIKIETPIIDTKPLEELGKKLDPTTWEW